jgi:Fur family transcriptional regulator, ferric uptake regulator
MQIFIDSHRAILRTKTAKEFRLTEGGVANSNCAGAGALTRPKHLEGKNLSSLTGPILATESQLGRAFNHPEVTRSSLMKELTARGVRITKQRRLIIAIIQDSPRHLDVATLLALARKKDSGIDRSTVYRTIGMLKRRGLIDELDLMHIDGEKHYYEVKTNHDHCHLACFKCGGVMEYTSSSFEKLKEEIARRSGFDIRVTRLEAGGICKSCRATSPSA